ncbi:GntR family transcriptional regulator [Terricaulis silvestris]|uniref:Carbon starvation induced regulator n=1 Tax=Terricaulis silvestris TaxID=2686094 RepID=A0A6I6MHE2_9CAUL|nr:GntR family transcriptional regulator [Terricaulis silvestris]QGZ93819.1 Carbon starvation induced regulator [Terricaulis silvestris]
MSADTGLKIEPRSLQAEVLDRLRDEIIRGVWKPGVRLQERTLCERFGISRSPLREAYQVLAAEGLLDLLRNRGAVVSTPSYDESMDAFTLLATLETLSIELACAKGTDDELDAIGEIHRREVAAAARRDEAKAFELNNKLHRAVVEASHNGPVMDAHLIVSRQIIRVQNATGFLLPDMPADEHIGFIEPLLKRSKAAAVKGLRAHLAHVRDNIARRLETLVATPEKRPAA